MAQESDSPGEGQMEDCPLGCHAETREVYRPRGAGTDRLEFEHDGFGSSRHGVGLGRVVQCLSCGLAWQVPMPSAETLARIYGEMQDDVYLDEMTGRQHAAKRNLRVLHRYRKPPGRLLDVGCSAGIFLENAQQAGWQVLGIEPSKSLSRSARERVGQEILNTTFEEADLEPESFETVILWDVLEHVLDPAAMIQRAASLLPPGGVLAINTPNIESWIAKLTGSRWPLLLPEHLHYFSYPSVQRMLESSGLKLLGNHSHVVYFSVGYLLHRLSQHAFPGVRLARNLARRLKLDRLNTPLLMGELMVFATKP